MNFMEEIRNELLDNVFVVVDDYETGEILYEGKLELDDSSIFMVGELDRDAVEFSDTQWVRRRDGATVALVTAKLTAEQREALLEYEKAWNEYGAWIDEQPIDPHDSLGERLGATLDETCRRWDELTK